MEKFKGFCYLREIMWVGLWCYNSETATPAQRVCFVIHKPATCLKGTQYNEGFQ